MKVVILAGGLGTRLSEETVARPKPLVEIGGRPILWHIMKIFSARGFPEFIICTGYKAHMIKDYFSYYLIHNSNITVDLKTGRVGFETTEAEPWTVTVVDTGETTMTGGRIKRAIGNYRDWLVQQYGMPIAQRWPLLYTEKYWTVPAEQLGTAWIGQRMRRPYLKEVLFGAMTERAPNSCYVNRMRYPERGGYRAFIEPLIDSATVQSRTRVVSVDPANRIVRSADGEDFPYSRLVSPVPLPNLVSMIADAPDAVRNDAATLFATSVDLISIGLRRAQAIPGLWFYIYDRDILAARAYSPSLKSADSAPSGCCSLQFEIYSSPRRPLQASVPDMLENSLAAMERMGLAARADVLLTHHKRLPFGNVVFDLGMERRRDRVRTWVEAQGIRLAGRFGEWDYLWSDQSFLSGRRAVLSVK